MTTKSKTKSGPCTEKTRCVGMDLAMRGGGERGIGFHSALMMTLTTGEMTSRLSYRLPKKTDGYAVIAVNYCPWCGAKEAP
jgi:hypothetical protein